MVPAYRQGRAVNRAGGRNCQAAAYSVKARYRYEETSSIPFVILNLFQDPPRFTRCRWRSWNKFRMTILTTAPTSPLRQQPPPIPPQHHRQRNPNHRPDSKQLPSAVPAFHQAKPSGISCW